MERRSAQQPGPSHRAEAPPARDADHLSGRDDRRDVGRPVAPRGQRLRPRDLLRLQRAAGNRGVNALVAVQRDGAGTATADAPTSGELAWELFSPIAKDGIRSLAPGILKGTKIGEHYKEVIEIVDKVEDSAKKIQSHTDAVKKLQKKARGHAASEREFSLKSMGKVHKHFASIPDALDFDAQVLTDEAAGVVTEGIFSDVIGAIGKLGAFADIVDQTKKLRAPYRTMAARLGTAQTRAQASFDALGVLEDGLLDLAKVAILPVYQAFLFSESQKVAGYRGDVGAVLSEIKGKKKGYEDAVAGSVAMEAYLEGAAGRKSTEESYRDPKSPRCLARVKKGLPALKTDPDRIYDTVLTYAECDYETVMDSLDFLPLDEEAGFYAVTSGLLDAHPEKASAIAYKEKRHQAATALAQKLDTVRPALEKFGAQHTPLLLRFVLQEYYRFLRDDPRNLLSSYRFTYVHQIEQLADKVDLLPLAFVAFAALS